MDIARQNDQQGPSGGPLGKLEVGGLDAALGAVPGGAAGAVPVPPPPLSPVGVVGHFSDEAVWALNSAYCLALGDGRILSGWEIYQGLKRVPAASRIVESIENLARHGASYTNQDFDILAEAHRFMVDASSGLLVAGPAEAEKGGMVTDLVATMPMNREANHLAEIDHADHGIPALQQLAWMAAKDTNSANTATTLVSAGEIPNCAAGFLHEDAASRHEEIVEALNLRIAVGQDGGMVNLGALRDAHREIRSYHLEQANKHLQLDGARQPLIPVMAGMREAWRAARAIYLAPGDTPGPSERQEAYSAALRDLGRRLAPGDDSADSWALRRDLAKEAFMLDLMGECEGARLRECREEARAWLQAATIPSVIERPVLHMTNMELDEAWAKWEPLVRAAKTLAPDPAEVAVVRALAKRIRSHVRPDALSDAELVLYMRPVS